MTGCYGCYHKNQLYSLPLMFILSSSFPPAVQVWNLTNCKLKSNLVGHTGYVNTVTVSPDGSLCASGGKVRGRVA